MAPTKCTVCKDRGDISLCNECYKKTIIVDNNMLMYVSSYRSKSSQLKMKYAVLEYYSNEDIASARQVMEDSVKHLIPEFPHLGKKRTDSTNRTASDIMIDDILDMFKSLDNVKDEVIPHFMCDDASKLPPSSPEVAGSMMAVMENIAAQQRQIQQMKESMCTMRVDYEKMRESVDDNHATITVVAQSMENLEHQSVGVHNAGDQIKHTVRSAAGEQVNKAEADASSSADQNGENRRYANALI